MNLLDKQIKAVQEAKEQCVGEALDDKEHQWDYKDCKLCDEFIDQGLCTDCPLGARDCHDWAVLIWGDKHYPNPQDLACFLYSLELYLKEQEKGLTKRSGLGII